MLKKKMTVNLKCPMCQRRFSAETRYEVENESDDVRSDLMIDPGPKHSAETECRATAQLVVAAPTKH